MCSQWNAQWLSAIKCHYFCKFTVNIAWCIQYENPRNKCNIEKQTESTSLLFFSQMCFHPLWCWGKSLIFSHQSRVICRTIKCFHRVVHVLGSAQRLRWVFLIIILHLFPKWLIFSAVFLLKATFTVLLEITPNQQKVEGMLCVGEVPSCGNDVQIFTFWELVDAVVLHCNVWKIDWR